MAREWLWMKGKDLKNSILQMAVQGKLVPHSLAKTVLIWSIAILRSLSSPAANTG